MITTNDLLDKVLDDLETLLSWCQADEESSYDAGAKAQEREDAKRHKRLSKAYDLLKDCRK